MTHSHATGADREAGVTIRFDARIPHARWAPLFHVFRVEQRGARLHWVPAEFPTRSGVLLDGAEVGLFLEPPLVDELDALTLEVSPMVVAVAAGHRLADLGELAVADILDLPFPGADGLHPEWTSFWTLDRYRGGPPEFVDAAVRTAEDSLEVVASGRAIATFPASFADGLAHPGVLTLPLRDGPQVRTRLVWRAGDDNPLVRSLIDLASAWTRRPER
jgi:DNA-binding transcriptional LysR family regulator